MNCVSRAQHGRDCAHARKAVHGRGRGLPSASRVRRNTETRDCRPCSINKSVSLCIGYATLRCVQARCCAACVVSHASSATTRVPSWTRCHVQCAWLQFRSASFPCPKCGERNADHAGCESAGVRPGSQASVGPSRLPPSPLLMYVGPRTCVALRNVWWVRS